MFDQAHKFLKFYYQKAKLKLPFGSYDEFIHHYRVDHFLLKNYGELIVHDDFLEHFDKALKAMKSDEDKYFALSQLAEKTVPGKTPTNQSFYDAIYNRSISFTFTEGVSAVKEGVQKTGAVVVKAAAVGVSLYLMWALAGLVLVYVMNRMAKK